MKALLKACIPNAILKKRVHLLKQKQNFAILAETYNQYQSIVQWSCIDKNNNPIPWYSYPAIEFLSQFDYTQKKILEWGSGNSSLFWKERSKEVVSIEHNKEWFKKIHKNKSNNWKLILKEVDEGLLGGR